MQVNDLVRFDPTRNCFVLKGPMKNHPLAWPDGTIKSTNNVFNWRAGITDTASLKPKAPNGRSNDLNSNSNITTYSKASLTRIPYGRTKKLDNYSAKI
jgi:hypothetical protein